MEKIGLAVDKVLGILLNTEWTAIAAGMSITPFNWKLEGSAWKYYVAYQAGPIRIWVGNN